MELNAKQLKMWAMFGSRATFGNVFTELAKENEELFIMTADFTKSCGLLKYAELYPNRYMSAGIAEQHMIGLASGLASEGYQVFACSFASFIATRCYEQVKINLGYMQQNVKLVGIAAGLGVSHQGNTHYGLDDVSLMTTIPNMTVIVPADCAEVAKATEALTKMHGPAYLRVIGEGLTPMVYTDDYAFEIGKGICLREGTDVLIVANGTMVAKSLAAAEQLAEQGISAQVINMHTVKPLDSEILREAVQGKKLVVTAEEGFVHGGLGSAVSEWMSGEGQMPKLIRLGVQDVFPHAGSYEYLLQQCGLTAEQIQSAIVSTIGNL